MFITYSRPLTAQGRLTAVNTLLQSLTAQSVAQSAAMDLIEFNDRFEAAIDMPGFVRECIQVEVHGRTVQVRAETKVDTTAQEATAGPTTGAEDKQTFLIRQRPARNVVRRFVVPADVDTEGVKATYEQGVLTLSLPKRESQVSRRITIN